MQDFRADEKRLLDLMINSIYTHKEIFLRELISNASDAIDKLYYRELDAGTTGIAKEEFAIHIAADKEKRTLTISDNGIGMTESELYENLGVIAESGTLRFRTEHNEEEIDSIGRFGVGFYSAFMVAKKVTVISRAYGSDEAYSWVSEGPEGFFIEASTKDAYGTDVIIEIKDDAEGENYGEFLDQYRLKSLIRKYSDYIRYPITMEVEKTREKEKTDTDAAPEYESYTETDTINSMTPLWKRAKSELTKELYDQFYMDKFADYEPPLHTIHTDVEGAVSYHALMFFPEKAPYNYYTKEFEKGLRLYSNGVLIMDKCADVLPDCFSFVKGLVDSPDLSLNISREILQHDKQLSVIATNIEKKIKNELAGLLISDREKYEKLWSAFGIQLKYGTYNSFGQKRELLEDLLLFYSMNNEKLVTLREYVDAMPESQEAIYYASGSSVQRISKLPQLDMLKERRYDALFLTDEVDEFVVQMLMQYAEKPFKSVAGNDFDLSDEEAKKAVEEQSEVHKTLLEELTTALDGRVKSVRLSSRLKTHAVCMTTEGPISIEMEKILNTMPGSNKVKAERVLELNPAHPIFEKLIGLGDEQKRKEYAEILYAQAQLAEGILPDDPEKFSEAVLGLMV